jgi:DNA-binding NarL/FixJ family response regulator
MKTITVLLADDHAVVRVGLGLLLSAEPDIKVAGEAANGREAVQMALLLRPDVIVMDLAMPELNGMEAARQLAAMGVRSKLLILSSYTDDEYIRQFIEAGVAGYLTKQTAASNLIRAVRGAAGGNSFFSPSIVRRFDNERHGKFLGSRQSPQQIRTITGRQREVLQLIAEGYPNKQTAAILGISIKTVEKHRQHLMDTLRIHDIAGLTRYAVGHGIVEANGGSPVAVKQAS